MLEPVKRPYLLAFHHLPDMHLARMRELLAAFKCPRQAWQRDAEVLGKRLGLKGERLRLWCEQKVGMAPEQIEAGLKAKGLHAVVLGEPGYPVGLAQMVDPPMVLYVQGCLPDWSRAVAIVGARHATAYGLRHAQRLAMAFAQDGIVVVSGVAAGIDGAAHRGALQVTTGLTVGVLGCGHDHVFPRQHRALYTAIARQGALISEFPPATPPDKWRFPQRNRIIAGLSAATVVIEAGARSGSLITCDFALEQGKTVFALPGPIDSPLSQGPHKLIQEGACLLYRSEDLHHEMGWPYRPSTAQPPSPPAAPEARALLQALVNGPQNTEQLAAATRLSLGQLSLHLLNLELAGYIRELPGARYSRA